MIVDPFDEQTINAVAPTKKGKRFSAPIISKRTKLYNGINQIGSFGVRISDDDSDALCIQDVQSFGISAINNNSKKPLIKAQISDYQEDNKLRFISADDRSLAMSGDTDINTWDQRKIRRRLNWRIGPLKKKQTSKKANATTSCKSVVSTSEKTSKSIHTMHSVETARIRNSNISSSGRRKILLSSQDRKSERKANSSRLSTIGEYDNGDDDGSVVLALNEDEAFDPNTNQYRTIDLFHKTEKFEKSNLDQFSPANSSHLPPRNSSPRGSSSISSSLSEIDDHSLEGLNLTHLQAISEGSTATNQSSKFPKGGISTNVIYKDFPKTPVHSSKKVSHSNAPSPVHTPSTAASDSSSHGDETSTDVQKNQSELNLKAMHHLAIQHLYHNEYKQSVEVLKEMLRGVLAIYGTSHTRVGTVHHNIATIYMRMGEFRKVVFHAQCAIRIRRSNILQKSVSLSDLAVSYTQLGLALLELEEYELSLNMLHKALAIQNKICSGSGIIKCSRLLNNIGCCLFKLDRWDEANIAFCDALEIQRRLLNSRDNSAHDGNNNEYTKEMDRRLLGIASTLSNVASICIQKDKCNDAYTYLEEALLLQQSVLGDMHNVSTSTKRSLDILQNKMDESNNEQSNYAQNCAKDKGPVCSNGQEIFNASMKFRNPLESLSDIQSELSLIFDDMLSSQKTCFQCVPTEIIHDQGIPKDNSSDLHWI